MFAAGCNRQETSQQITQFDDSVKIGSTAIAAYYTNLNEQEYNLYFELLEIDPDFEVGDKIKFTISEKGKPKDYFLDSPLKAPPFSPRVIEARINTLRELTEYSKNLAALAGDESPAKFQTNVATLKDRLISLQYTFAKLRDETASDRTAKNYITPLSDIIGIVGKWHLEKRRWNALQKAIIEAEIPVNIVLDQIAYDLDSYVDPLLDTAADDRYTTAVAYYNLKRTSLKPQERTEILGRIRDYKSAYDTAALYKPSSIPNQMKKAHTALVKTAKSNRSPANLAALKAELELLKDDVEKLKTATQQILGRKENNQQ